MAKAPSRNVEYFISKLFDCYVGIWEKALDGINDWKRLKGLLQKE